MSESLQDNDLFGKARRQRCDTMLIMSVLDNPATTLKLSIQRVLIGEVTLRLHSVTRGLRQGLFFRDRYA